MNRKRISLLLLLLLGVLIPSGCWDRRELEEQAYVVAMGVDLTADNPHEKILTAQLVIPAKLGGGGKETGGEEKSFYQISVRSTDLFSALNEMNAVTSRRISLLQCRVIFFSEDLAKQGIGSMVRAVEKYPELRRTVFVGVVTGRAKDFLQKNVPRINPNITKYWEETAVANDYIGYKTISTVQKLDEGMSSVGQNAILSLAGVGKSGPQEGGLNPKATELPREGGTKGEFIGVAVFKRDKMVGKLGKQETEALNIIRGDWRSALYSIPDPADPALRLGFMLRQHRSPEITLNLAAQPPQITVQLKLVASFVGQFSMESYFGPDKRRKLEEALDNDIEQRSSALVSRAQHEFNSDILKLGDRAVREKFWTWKQWEDFNWPEKFPEVQVNVIADVSVLGIGSQREPAPERP